MIGCLAVRPRLAGLALCAGVGGLELGLRLALGDAYRTVGYVERDAYAAAVLVARMADEALDRAPVWDDITTFDGQPWRGCVDLVSAGFPCQPSSSAGRRRGTADERWLWPDIARVIEAVEPRLVFIENVRGLLTVNRGAAFEEVVETLADLGFDAEWDLFSAAKVGAPHLRERLFLLAYRDGDGRALVRREQLPSDGQAPRRYDADGRGRAELADADADRLGEHHPREPIAIAGCDGAAGPGGAGRTVADAYGDQLAEGRGRPACVTDGPSADSADRSGLLADPGRGRRPDRDASPRRVEPDAAGRGRHVAVANGGGSGRQAGGPSVDGWAANVGGPSEPVADPDLGHVAVGGDGSGLARWGHEALAAPFPPGPAQRDAWSAILAERSDLAPAVEPAIRGVADGLAHRVDRLRAAGNGVVPLVAAVAFLALAARGQILNR